MVRANAEVRWRLCVAMTLAGSALLFCSGFYALTREGWMWTVAGVMQCAMVGYTLGGTYAKHRKLNAFKADECRGNPQGR